MHGETILCILKVTLALAWRREKRSKESLRYISVALQVHYHSNKCMQQLQQSTFCPTQ